MAKVIQNSVNKDVGYLKGKVEGIDTRMADFEGMVQKGFGDLKDLVKDHSEEAKKSHACVMRALDKHTERIDRNEKRLDTIETTFRVLKWVSAFLAGVLAYNYDTLFKVLMRLGF